MIEKRNRLQIVSGDMCGGRGAILSQGNLISRRENSFFADFAAGVRRTQAKSGVGGSGGGDLLPRPPAKRGRFCGRRAAPLRLKMDYRMDMTSTTRMITGSTQVM